VRVTDFGLARPARSSQEKPGQAEEGPGTLAGTPAYMAPEQAAGREVDARSDQFSFAVSLWEALFGQRPYQVALTEKGIKADWSPPAVPQGSRVPARIRRALLKALSVDPAARFASMDDLLAALAPSRRRARLVPLAALVLLALGAAGLATVTLRRPSALCSGAEGALAQAMPEPTLAACGEAFAATGLPGAEQTWQRVRSELERYGRAWVSAHVEACEATRVRGEQSEEILDRRMVCLERRRSELASLVELFAKADGPLVKRAVEAAQALAPVNLCSDLTLLTAEGALPREAAKRQAIEAQYRVLDNGRALEHAARYGEAAVVAEQVKREAERLGYVPLQAEALLLLGQVQARPGTPSEAEAALFDAIRRGFAGDERRLVIEAAIRLADFIAWGRNERFEEALRWLAIAEAGLDRLGERGELRARCLSTRGAVLASQLRYVDAIESNRRAVEIFERISPDSIDAAIAYNSLAFTAMAQGLHQEAFDALEKAARIYDARLGKKHDRTIGTRANTGTVLLWLGRADERARDGRASGQGHRGEARPRQSGGRGDADERSPSCSASRGGAPRRSSPRGARWRSGSEPSGRRA
jgi:tetratricopeptide (TPR) repeat protein